jgi:hypothetical protein
MLRLARVPDRARPVVFVTVSVPVDQWPQAHSVLVVGHECDLSDPIYAKTMQAGTRPDR